MRRTAGRLTILALAALWVAAPAGAAEQADLYALTARAAIVVDAQTGEVQFARNANLPLPPASTTKVLTALLALRETAPDELLRVSAHAASMPPSKAYLRSGSVLTSRDLLYALMLRSANDASVVIAEHVGGSVPGFARMMNRTAKSLGATSSHFITPNGLPAKGHVSTVQDLATIMRAALQTPGMRTILSTRTQTIEPVTGRTKRIALRSTNRLLWREDLTVIGKTGWTREAKRCFVGAASLNGREVIVAVLGSRDLWADVEMLAHYGLGRAVPGYDDLRRRAGVQQAALSPVPPAAAAPGVTWYRGTAPAAPPARAGRPAAAPAMRTYQEAAKPAPAARPQVAARSKRVVPQGDREELQRRAGLKYHLHLASYRSKTRAEQVSRDLVKRGYRARVESTGGAYRVAVRDFSSRDAARKAARTLGRSLRVEPVIVASR